MTDWQPIETALADGVLVFVPHKRGRIISGCVVAKRRGEYWYTIPTGIRIAPTHWMPLPDAPDADEPFTLE